jgi:hypothetical protein
LHNNTLLSVPSCSRHCHLLKLRLTNSSMRERCLEKAESATHPVWVGGNSLFKVSSPESLFHGAPVKKDLCFMGRTVQTEEGEAQYILEVAVQAWPILQILLLLWSCSCITEMSLQCWNTQVPNSP